VFSIWSNIKEGVLLAGSLTTSESSTILGPPLRIYKILISLLIFLFLTGLRTFTTTFFILTTEIPKNTSEYFPLPIFLITS